MRSIITATTDEIERNTARESGGSESDTEATQCIVPDAESQRSSEIFPLTFNSQSLLQARFYSKRTKRSANESEDQCTEVDGQLGCTGTTGENADCFDALTTVEEDMEPTADSVLTCTEPDHHVDSQMEECSLSLLGSRPVLPPPSTRPPTRTPSPAPPPSPPSLSLDSCMSETEATGFDELESVGTEVEDEFSTAFGPPPAFEEAQRPALAISPHLDLPLQADGQGARQQTAAHKKDNISEFHELECLSEIGSSVDEGSFTDWEVDFDGAFSTDGEELEETVLEDTVACVPNCGYAQTPTERATTVLDQNADNWPNDSEWNDLTMDSHTLLPPNQRETPAISILQVNDQLLSPHCNSLLDYPKSVDSNEETAGYTYHEATTLCTSTRCSQSCVSQACVSNDSPHRRTNNDSWNSSDLEWDPEDFTESAGILMTSPPATRKPSIQNSDGALKYKFTTGQQPQWTIAGRLEAGTVPDIMNESLTCDVAEEDFHWD